MEQARHDRAPVGYSHFVDYAVPMDEPYLLAHYANKRGARSDILSRSLNIAGQAQTLNSGQRRKAAQASGRR